MRFSDCKIAHCNTDGNTLAEVGIEPGTTRFLLNFYVYDLLYHINKRIIIYEVSQRHSNYPVQCIYPDPVPLHCGEVLYKDMYIGIVL